MKINNHNVGFEVQFKISFGIACVWSFFAGLVVGWLIWF